MLATLMLCLLATAVAVPSAGPTVREAPIRAHMAFLSDDLLEGRGTGQRGGDLAVKYLEAQLRALGLTPGAGDSFLQQVDLLGVKLVPERSRLSFRGPRGEYSPKFLDEIAYGAGNGMPDNAIDAPVLFVGFGIDAPAERWDDYKGADCRGKLLVMMVNEPPPTAEAPGRFDGENLSYFGRWTYKFEEAARREAAGVLLIHTDASATYGWSVAQRGFVGEKFQLADGPRLSPLVGWIREDAARKLFALGGKDLDGLRRQAQSRDFHPVELDVRAEVRLASAVRNFPQDNVAAVLPGSDPKLKDELVIYSAHWDHFGIQDGRIYNGAVDNGSALATLLAIAQASVDHPARRSQMFLFTCAEEQGLLGSFAYVQRPLWPLDKTVADLNLESLNWVGPSHDIEFLGGDRSDLQKLGEETANALGMVLQKPQPDLQGLYFRSDHFPFAKAGIPALSPGFSLAGQRDYLGDGEALRAKAATFLDRYHQESDDYDPSWDLRGMVQQGQFILDLGRRIADSPTRPQWKSIPATGLQPQEPAPRSGSR
ncbi:MAG: M28 family peptidase [Acidobacteriota bacterium]